MPPPRWHATRYFGVLAPASKARPKIVSEAEQRETPEVPELVDDGGAEDRFGSAPCPAPAEALQRENLAPYVRRSGFILFPKA